MKKIAVIAAMMLLASTSVYAAGTLTMTLTKDGTGKTLYGHDTTATADTSMIGKTSSGVGLSIASASVGYALSTQHLSGSKAFASSFDSTSIFSVDVAAIGGVELDVTASDTSEFSAWKPL